MPIQITTNTIYYNTLNLQKKNIKKDNNITFKNASLKTSITQLSKKKMINMTSLTAIGTAIGITIKNLFGKNNKPKQIYNGPDYETVFNERIYIANYEDWDNTNRYIHNMLIDHYRLKKAFKRNPNLVQELMTSKITEKYNNKYDSYSETYPTYSDNAIILIEKYSQKHPELTNNYKEALYNSYIDVKLFGLTLKKQKERLDEITTISHQKSV